MRRAVKISGWVLTGVVLTVLLLMASLYIAGNTDPGRRMIEKLTAHLTSGHVSLHGLAGRFPQDLTLERLELSDERGVWFSAERLTASWSPFALLTDRIEVNALHAALVDMERLPESTPGPKNAAPPSIPRIDAANVSVDVVKLGAELAGAPASLVLAGNAHLRTVLDMVIDARAHRLDGDGDYDLQLRFDPKRMDAHLVVHEPAGGPLENILQLPGLGALSVTLDLKGPRAAEGLDLAVDAGSLRGRAQGNFNLSDLSSDLDIALDSQALAPRADLGWERASLHGHWQGSIKSPKANARLEIVKLRVPGGVQLANLNGELTADAGKAALQGLVNGVVIPGPRPQLLADAPIKLEATMRLDAPLRPLEVSASHRLFTLRGTADTAASSAGERRAEMELRLLSVTELAAIGGQDAHGSALFRAQVRILPKSTRLALNATAALHDGTEVWAGMVGDNARLELEGAMTDETLQFDSVKLTGRSVALNASGAIARDAASTMKARWDGEISDLATLAPMLAGTLKASGTVAGPAASLAADVQATASLAVRGSARGTLSAGAKLRGLPSAPSGTVLAQGSLDGAPLSLDLSMERSAGGTLHAVIHRGEWRSVHADGEINLQPPDSQARGQVNIAIGQLADLNDFLGAKLGGGVTASLKLHPEERHTAGQITLDAKDVSLGQFLGNVQLSAEGATDAMGFKLGVQSEKLAGAKTSLAAAGSLDLNKRKILVSSATAKYREQDVKLLAPAQISLANGVGLDDLKLGAGRAVLDVAGSILPGLDAHLALTGVGPAEVNGFMPETLASGKIEAHADLGGRLDEPTGKLTLSASDVRMADDSALGLPAVDLQASARLLGDVANIDAKLDAGSASQLSLTGRAPLAEGGALDLKVSGKLDIGMINPLLEARGQHAAGELTVDATVTGDVSSPQIDGSVKIAKGSVRDYSRGFSLTAITADMVGSEGTLEIKSFSASAAPGTVTVTGKVGLLQEDIPVDIQIKAQNAQPLVSKLVTANLDADLHLVGTARERLDINGSVQLHRTLIGIPSSLPPNVAVLDVRRRGKAAVVAPEKQLVIGMDITVQAPQEILVQGRGLDAEMGGDLHLTGTTDAPLVTGGFDLQRGFFSLAGSKLNFSTGRVSFNGAGLKGKIDPTLDFVAQTTVSDTTATLQIAGLADAPQFAFTSTPSKPQDEIMALLLFGAPPQQLSGLQLAQIGALLASLSGVGGDTGLNPLAKLQKSLGLDRLNVGSGTTNTPTGPENAGAAIEAGRYISKRVYVAAKQSTQGNSQLEADIDLTKHLKLQTRVGNGTGSVLGTTPENDPGSSIGLSYQFEY